MNKKEFLESIKIVEEYYNKNPGVFCSEMEAEYMEKIWYDTIWNYLDCILTFKLSSMLKNGCSDSYCIGFVEGFKQGLEYLKLQETNK